MSVSEYNKAIDGIAERIGFHRRYQKGHFDRQLFLDAVREWCDAEGWQVPSEDDSLHFFWEHISRIAFITSSVVRERKKSESKTAWLMSNAKDGVARLHGGLEISENDYNQAIREAVFCMEPRDILLVAFSAAAVLGALAAGFVIAQKKRSPNSRDPSPHAPNAGKHVPPTWHLVLVVNAESDIIKTLRQGRFGDIDSDKLYQATQSLWMGDRFELTSSSILEWFNEERSATKQTEYDVYLIRIELEQHDSGLRRGANQMDRLDAFRRIPLSNATVSSRLPPDAYGAAHVFYKR